MPKISTYGEADLPLVGTETVVGVQSGVTKQFILGEHLAPLGIDGKIPGGYLPAVVGLGDMVQATYDPAEKEEQVLTIGDFGTGAGEVAEGDDSRFTNSREWTAETISEAEAEAGVATTRRAVTAERLKQAINALAGPPVITGGAEPTVNDDSGDGYIVGQIWSYNGQLWVLTDSTVGDAVWLAVSGEEAFAAFFSAMLAALSAGAVWSTHGGADETYVPAYRENVGEGAVQLNEGAFLPVAAEAGLEIISDATYTIQPEDFGKHLHFSHATPAVTVAPQATETYGPNFYALLSGDNAFTVTFGAAVDGNGESASVWNVNAVSGAVSISRKGSDDWLIIGDTTIDS
jgi:hypothetical protein